MKNYLFLKKLSIMLFVLFVAKGLSAQVPDNWSAQTPLVTIEEEASIVNEGSKSAKITWTSKVNQDIHSAIFSVTAGAIYTYNLDIYDNDPAGRVRMCILWDNGTKYDSYSSDQDSWQTLSLTDVVPNDVTTAQIKIRLYDVSSSWVDKAIVYIDNATFTENGGANLIPNSSFESWSIPTATPYTINQIQSENHASELVQTTGIVTAVYASKNLYTIQDGTGAYSGVWVSGTGVALGDNVTVEGTVVENYDLTQINSTSVIVNTSGNVLPAAAILTTGTATEEYEGVLVKVELAQCTNADLGNGEWELNDGSGALVIDDLAYVATIAVDNIYTVTGALNYSYDKYKIEPRDAADIIETAPPTLTDAKLKDIKIDGSTVGEFVKQTYNYSVSLIFGTTIVPVVTAETNAITSSYEILDATDVTSTDEAARTTTIDVTAEDGTTTLQYKIVFNVNTAVIPNVFMSEVADPKDIYLNRFVELFNASEEAINLGDNEWNIVKQSNGEGYYALPLTGTIQAGGTYIVASDQATFSVTYSMVADQEDNSIINGNGDDGYYLYMSGDNVSGILVDAYGVQGEDGTGKDWEYLDAQAVRKPGITSPNSTWTATEWTINASTNAVDMTPGTHVPNIITASDDATLRSIYLTSGELSPALSAEIYEYTVELEKGTTSLPTVTVEPNNDSATYGITDATSATSTNEAARTTTIDVTAPDGTTTLTYKVVFNVKTIVQVSNIAELRAGELGKEYKLTGEAVVTWIQSYRNQKYIQDATGAVLIDDGSGKISASYTFGDGITGLTGTLSEYGGMLQFIPTQNHGEPTSNANIIDPETITLDQFNANFEDYEGELVKIENIKFQNAEGSFANGSAYGIIDETSTMANFRSTFYDVDYIGDAIPTESVTIIGICNSRPDGTYISSRNKSEIILYSGTAPSIYSIAQSPTAPTATSTVTVTANVDDDGDITLVELSWGVAIDALTNVASMSVSLANQYTTNAPIPAQAEGTVVYYQITATDNTDETNSSDIISYSIPYTSTIEVANIAELKAKNIDGQTTYKITGEVTLTWKQSYRAQKYLQDATGAILVDDYDGVIQTNYNMGDGITNITGTIAEYGGMIQLTPTENTDAATSIDNVIEPQVISITEFNSNFEDYKGELVEIENVSFTAADGTATFVGGASLEFTDAEGNIANFRSSFYDAVDYDESIVPQGDVTIIGICNLRSDGVYITSRSLSEIIIPHVPVAPVVANVATSIASPGTDDIVDVTAEVTDEETITSVILMYGTESGNLIDGIEMAIDNGNTYKTQSSIPAQIAGTTIYYQVKAINSMDMEAVSAEKSYTILVSDINDINSIKSVVYPNPANTTLSISNTANINKVVIANLVGQNVRVLENNTSDNLTLDIENLENGLYLISLHNTNGQVKTIKVIKQ